MTPACADAAFGLVSGAIAHFVRGTLRLLGTSGLALGGIAGLLHLQISQALRVALIVVTVLRLVEPPLTDTSKAVRAAGHPSSAVYAAHLSADWPPTADGDGSDRRRRRRHRCALPGAYGCRHSVGNRRRHGLAGGASVKGVDKDYKWEESRSD